MVAAFSKLQLLAEIVNETFKIIIVVIKKFFKLLNAIVHYRRFFENLQTFI